MGRSFATLALALTGLTIACPAAAGTALTWASQPQSRLTQGSSMVRYLGLTIPGVAGTYRMATVTWPLADPRYRLQTVLPGGAPRAGGWLPVRGLAQWSRQRRTAGLVAALTPDMGSYRLGLAHTSGLLVRNGVLLHAQADTLTPPSVGYTTTGEMVFGTPRAVPLTFLLPNAAQAAVGAIDAPPSTPDQVGIYRRAGTTVPIPGGYAAVTLAFEPTRAALVQSPAVRATGRPVVYVLHQAYRPLVSVPVSFTPVDQSRASATVPQGGAVLLMQRGGSADQGFAELTPGGVVSVTQTDTLWREVRNVMGGKPMLVSAGQPIAVQPLYVSDFQWSAAAARAAIGRTGDGRGIMVVVSTRNRSGSGISLPVFGRLLSRLGVSDAIGLDGGPVPELVTPRVSSTTCAPVTGMFCYRASPTEWPVPAATALFYTP